MSFLLRWARDSKLESFSLDIHPHPACTCVPRVRASSRNTLQMRSILTMRLFLPIVRLIYPRRGEASCCPALEVQEPNVSARPEAAVAGQRRLRRAFHKTPSGFCKFSSIGGFCSCLCLEIILWLTWTNLIISKNKLKYCLNSQVGS